MQELEHCRLLPGKQTRGSTYKYKLRDPFYTILHGADVYTLAQKEIRKNELGLIYQWQFNTKTSNSASKPAKERCSFLYFSFLTYVS